MVFLFASLNIQAQGRECDTNAALSDKNQQEHQDKPSTKTVVNNKIKKSKSASGYFGMFKMLIPVSSK